MRRVSVIVPAYNYAAFLPDALESVLAQTFAGWECVIVDDGSTDETPQVARRYADRDGRFRYVRQENRGLAGARNTGIGHAEGELIQFLDADDRLLPEKLARHVAYLDEHPETGIVYSEVGFFTTEEPDRLYPSLGRKLSQSIMGRVHGADEAREKLQHYNIMPVLAALVRREAIARAGVFDEELSAVEDYAFWIRCAAAGCRFDYLPTDGPLAAVRAHRQSMSRDYTRMIRGLIAASKAYARQLPGSEPPLIYQVAAGYDLVDRGKRWSGARAIWRAGARATERLTGWRWKIYALAALLLPRGLFLRFASTPVPEAPFEIFRRVRRWLKGRPD